MATKPGLSAFTHATDANIGSGPAAGFPTKNPVPSPAQGFIPGLGISAQQVNTVLNEVGTWLNNWVSKGTFSPDTDAHIVETNSTGKIFVIECEVGSITRNASVLVVNNASASVTAGFENHGTGAALWVTADATLAVIEAMRVNGSRNADAPIATFFKLGAGAHLRGALFTETQADPSNIIEGDFHITPSFGGVGQAGRSALVRSDQTDGGTQFLRVWDTNKGYFFRSDQSTGISVTSNNEGSLVTKLTLSVDPGAGGKYKVTFSCAIASLTGTDTVVGVKLDTGISGRDKTYKVLIPAIQQWQTLHATWIVDGNAAVMVHTIEFFSVNGSDDVQISDAEIIFEGSHDEIYDPPAP